MTRISIEFGMPFRNQELPQDWVWDAFEVEYDPNVDYQKLARLIVRSLPFDGPSNVQIKADDSVVAVWSKLSERCDQLGI